ncbi:hypothetical protein AB3480_06965 [Rhizobium mongolense]|nr:hypothetical protein [Rhizobium mongolense]
MDYEALFDALRDEHLGGAGLDVFFEGAVRRHGSLARFAERHRDAAFGGITRSSMSDIAKGVAENILRLHAGEQLVNRVA